MSHKVVNSEAIKEFLYHSLSSEMLEYLDKMFTSLDGNNFMTDKDGFSVITFPEIKLKGTMFSGFPSNLYSVHLQTPKIYALYPDHKG